MFFDLLKSFAGMFFVCAFPISVMSVIYIAFLIYLYREDD